jgi:hypothetical protein
MDGRQIKFAFSMMLLFILVVSCASTIYINIRGEKCATYGYPDYTTVGWEIYCKKKVDNSDVVMPLKRLQQE